jgi:hypothetical protein
MEFYEGGLILFEGRIEKGRKGDFEGFSKLERWFEIFKGVGLRGMRLRRFET